MLHAQDYAENIRLERRGIGFRGLVRDRANPAVGASIVDRDIETAKLCDGPVDQSADFILVADVGVDELGLRSETAQFLGERLADVITPRCPRGCECGDRGRELVSCPAPRRRFGRCQPCPPLTGAPGDRALATHRAGRQTSAAPPKHEGRPRASQADDSVTREARILDDLSRALGLLPSY